MRESSRAVEAPTAANVITVGLQGRGEALVLPEPSENWPHGGQRIGHPTGLWSWGHVDVAPKEAESR